MMVLVWLPEKTEVPSQEQGAQERLRSGTKSRLRQAVVRDSRV